MEEQQGWERSRYAALLGVLALHVTVLTGLLVAAKTRFHTTPAATPIKLLVLPKHVAPTAPPPTSLDRRKKLTAAPLPPPPDALTAVTPNPTSEVAGPQIDWSQEAHNVAENIARGATAPDETKPSAPSNAPFAAPSPHQKGDQIPTADGRWMVFVSEDCYQLSKELTHITNATNTGVIIQTYCNRRSKEPRGDLFKQLPAYKRLHPEK